MIDQDFLGTLTVLYVEDDKDLRKSFSDILNKLFCKVILVDDGLSALEIFKDSLNCEETIDAIISDIKLPKLNGLDLLEEVRKHDENVPFIFTTAFYEAENLLKSIKLGVSEFFIKPLDAKEVINHVQKVCEKRHQETRIIHYQNEIKKYIEVIDQVAIVSRINKRNQFKFVNEFFCEVSGYKEDEILKKPIKILHSDDTSEDVYKEMWRELEKGNVYRGKLKHIAKDGVPFFVTTTIFPVYDEKDEKILEYFSIEFLTTEYENQKREFKKKVMYNLQETRRINTVARKKIDDLMKQVRDLEEQLKSYVHYDVLLDKLSMEKKRSSALNSQIKYYEEQVKKGGERYEKVSNEITQRIYNAETETSKVKSKSLTALKEVEFLRAELATSEKHKDKMNNLIEKQILTIADYEQVIKHQDEKLVVESKKKK